MATTNDPIKNVSDLSLSELQTIVRRAQETLWLDDGTGKWRAREDWSEGDSAYVLLTYIADLLAEYDLEPIEEGEPDEPEEPVDGDLWTEDHHKLWEFGMHRPKPAVVVPEGEDWEPSCQLQGRAEVLAQCVAYVRPRQLAPSGHGEVPPGANRGRRERGGQ